MKCSEAMPWGNELLFTLVTCCVKRILSLLFATTIIATACASAATDTTAAGDDTAAEAESDAEAENPTAPADESAEEESGEVDGSQPQEIDGPKETFNPPLEGPFNLDGGITFDPAAVDVIVDPAPNGWIPATFTNWPTDWTRRTVEDWDEFAAGLRSNDPRDGIPPIDEPIFETVSLASEWIAPNEPGALVQLNGEARFYPLAIMTAHEIVNDAFGDIPVSVTYCPLCNTAIAFDRRVNGEVLDFGVSGLLRNSDLVMWDRQTTSLWQQITGNSVIGEFAGAELEPVPTSIVSFGQFAEGFPDGLSLAGESARGREAYGINPYTGYSSSPAPIAGFFSADLDDRLPALSRVIGISEGDAVVAYSFDRIAAEMVINDEVNGVPLVVLGGGDTTDALDSPFIASAQTIGSAVAYSPVVDGQTLTFTANDDDTFTDDVTGSTWLITGNAIEGELAGTQLEGVEHRNEFWFAWQAFFGPDFLSEA